MPTLIRYRVNYDAVVMRIDGDHQKVEGAVAVDARSDLSGPQLWDCVASYLWTELRGKAKQISILYVGEFRDGSTL